ncbi:MAG TPA: HEAT repeat domain-containing protein [Verrucomicrobiae bacterium]|nr:HEAT repeat domain-containing protein [Verrucomicrobiae bacterium]
MSATLNSETWSMLLKEFTNSAAKNSRASEQQLLKVETKLKIKLPPSYRTFLSASNGWRLPFEDGIVLRPVEDIRWFRKEHKHWYEAYQTSNEPICVLEKDYFDYTKQDCVVFEIKHLAQTLCISEVADDAVLLLNPMVIWPDGEWETWYFSNSSPGATRYRSFADWINHELDQGSEPFQNSGELPTVYLDAPGKENRRIRPRQKVPVLEQVLKKLKSNKEQEREKAADQLAWLGGKEAVQALIGALNDSSWYVRWHAADSLGVLRPPEALEALIKAADGSLDGVNTNAIHALRSFSDERSAQFLLKMLEGGDSHASQAGYVLSLRGDVRAIQPMVQSLISKAEGSRATWGNLNEFGDAGYIVLEPLMNHADVEIRKRAEPCICSLAHHAKDKSVRRKAFELLKQRLESETDVELRKKLEISIQICREKNK